MKLSKGLYKDTDPIDQLLGTYPNARNVLINKVQGAIVNELGFSRITDLNKKIVGSIPITKDEIIIFSRDDDSNTQLITNTYIKFSISIPNTMSGNLTITYTNSDNIIKTEIYDIDELNTSNPTDTTHTIYPNQGQYILQSSSTAVNNFTYAFDAAPPDPDNTSSNLTVATIGNSITINEETYISEIGRLSKAGVYTSILRSKKLKFRSDSFLKGCYILNYKKEVIISWTDNKTQPKILNIDALPFEVDASTTLILNERDIVLSYLFPEFKRPKIVYKEVLDSGGALKSGAYFLSFAYELEDGSQTNYTPLEGPFIVTNSTLELSGSYRRDQQSNFDIVSSYDGCEPATTTSKSIKFSLTDVDARYKYLLFSVYKKIGGEVTSEYIKKIEIAGAAEEDIETTDDNATIISSTESQDAGFTITYTGKETASNLLLEDISVGNEVYSSSKTITYFENKLYLGNVTTNPDFNYQSYAMDIKATWVRDYIDINSVKGSYKNELMVYNKRGFRPDEVYAFYISFLYNDGTWSGGYHIPGREKNYVTVALQDGEGDYLTPITIGEDTKLQDIVLGDVEDGTLTASDRVKYEDIFQHDLGIHKDARYFQTRETARVDGTMGFWQNEGENYPQDEDTFGTSAGTQVRHHKFPGYEAMNGLNTSFVDPTSDGSQLATGTGDLIVIAYMETADVDLRHNLNGDHSLATWYNQGDDHPNYDYRYTRERVWHHLYLYVGAANGVAAPGYYLLAKSRDPRDFTVAGKPHTHYLTDTKIEISDDMRRGGAQHSMIPPSQIVNPGSTGVTVENLYPNMLSPNNLDKLIDGPDDEYEGCGMGKNLATPIPELPYVAGVEFEYLSDPENLQYYQGKTIGHYYWKWYKKPWCMGSAHKSRAYSRVWGEGEREKGCGRLHSSWDWTMKSDPIITEKDQPEDVFPVWWNDISIEAASGESGNGIKTLRTGVEFEFTAGLGNYLQPSYITSQPYGAEGAATVKQTNAIPAVASSALASVTFDSFHYNASGIEDQVAQTPVTAWTGFATTVTGDIPCGFWSNDNYTYTATISHTLYLTGKFGIEFKTKRLSGAPAGDQTIKHNVISGIRKVIRRNPTDTTTWIREDIFRNRESKKAILKATNDAITTSTRGGNFISEDVENVFRPDLCKAITLQAGDVLQFYHETVVTGTDASYTASDYETRATYEFDLQVLTYKYTLPEPDYSPYSMYAAVLGIRFSNIKIPSQLKDRIQGYQIFYAERDNTNMQTFDQSIAFHGAPHAIYPNQQGTYAGHLIPLGGLNLIFPASNVYGDSGTGYASGSWEQDDDTEGGMSLDTHPLAKQHKIIPTSLRFHGFDLLNTKAIVQSAYIKQVSKLGTIEYTDSRVLPTLNVEGVAGDADKTNFTRDPSEYGNDDIEGLGVYTKTPGIHNSIDTKLQASYNQIWNRYGTSSTSVRNPSFKLINSHYDQIRQLRNPTYVPGDTSVNKKSLTINNTYGEECLHASIVHYDNEDTWSEINHHTGFTSLAVSGGVTTYSDPKGWHEIKSHYQTADGTDVRDQPRGPVYNLIDLKSFKSSVYDSYYDQRLVSTNIYNKLGPNDLLSLQHKEFITKETGPIFGGDTFVSMYGLRLTAPIFYSNGKSTIVGNSTKYYRSENKFHAAKNIFYFPVYSTSNISLRHSKDILIDNYYPRCGIGALSNPDETATINDILNQKKQALHNWRGREVTITNSNILNYNEDYTSINSYNTLTTYDNRDKFLDKFPYRIVRSQAYGVENKTMALKQFKTNDYYEMPKNRGYLTNLEGIGKELLIHHEHSLFKTTTKDVIATDTATATLGTGDIFAFEPTELITSENGYAGCQHLSSVLISKAGYSFVDAEQGKVFLVSNELQELSNIGLRNWFDTNIPFNTTALNTDTPFNLAGAGFTTAFDEENNRIILGKKDVTINAVVYNDVQIPTEGIGFGSYCETDEDGNFTGRVVVDMIYILDQYGNVIEAAENSESGVYASFYIAPYFDNVACNPKPNVFLNWEGNVWEGDGKLKLIATIDAIQTDPLTVTVQYSGVFDETVAFPSTTITIPAGSLEGFAQGSTVPTDNVVEIVPEETLTATIIAVTRPDGAGGTIEDAANITGSDPTVIVYDCPVLVNDSKSGITNGGTVSIFPLTNDTLGSAVSGLIPVLKIVSLAVDGSGNSIGVLKDPGNSNATLTAGATVQGTEITFTHAGGSSSLTGSFVYSYTKGPCTSTATVSLQAIAVSNNTYIKIYFDSSGSMNTTLDDLEDMRTAAYTDSGGLKSLLQDFYASGQTQAQGNTDTATNGAADYLTHVTLESESSERTFHMLNNEGAGFDTGAGEDFPDAENVVIFVFQDEANPPYHDSTFVTSEKTSQYDTDIAALRTSIASINGSDTTFYRANIFQTLTNSNNEFTSFRAFIQAVRAGSGSYSGNNGLSASPYTTYVQATYDVTPDNGKAYYKGLIQTALQNLGYSV